MKSLSCAAVMTAVSTRIVITDKVFFQTGSHKILAKSFQLLTRVAEILKPQSHEAPHRSQS